MANTRRHQATRAIALCMLLAVTACSGGGSTAAPPKGNTVTPAFTSRVTTMSITGQLAVGTFKGIAYTKTYGQIGGVIDPKESSHLVGLAAQTPDANGNIAWTSKFEIIAPNAGSPPDTVVLVDVENRSTAISLNSLNQSPASTGGNAPDTQMWASGMGNGFLQNNATAYGRVQWQSATTVGGDNVSIANNAQGIGLLIERDFGRMLAGMTPAPAVTGATFTVPTFATRIITGISQSAWAMNTVIAEGFNVDPTTGSGVFQGAIGIDGTGNWLAVNELGLAAGAPMNAYVNPLANASATPLNSNQLLSRGSSDPFYIDVANYTDFYRVFASLTDVQSGNPRTRRYDWPGPHGQGSVPASASGVGTFAPNAAVTEGGACDAGLGIATNPIGYQPYFRAIFFELERTLGVPSAGSAPSLPASIFFTLGPPPAVRNTVVNGATLDTFNDSIGANLQVPVIDANLWPLGGVRTPDELFPIGAPTTIYPNGAQAVSVPPTLTNSISDTCGNSGEFTVFTGAQLTARYGTQANYLAQYDTQIQALIAGGYILPSDEAFMLTTAGNLYNLAAAGPPYNGGANF
jgi:hypothetical protein